MKKRVLLLAALSLLRCNVNEAPTASAPDPQSPKTHELGTLKAIYPVPEPDGSYSLELRLTLDTVIVALSKVQAYASDSLGKAIFTSTSERFYTEDGLCFYNRKKPECLEYRQP